MKRRIKKTARVSHTIRASWTWHDRWSDEVDNVKRLASDMREAGIRATTTPSMYVGHRTLAIHPEDIRLATAYLRSIGEGYIADSYDGRGYSGRG